MTAEFTERRFHARHKARTKVQVRPRGGKPAKYCNAVNLSATGVAVATEDMSLPVGSFVELAFTIDLAPIVKIHRRDAEVRHVTNGVTGFAMQAPGFTNVRT